MNSERRSTTVRIGDTTIAFVQHRSDRRKHVQLTVDKNGVTELRTPWRFSLSEAKKNLRENAIWLLEALAEVRRNRRQPLASGDRLPFLNQELKLQIEVSTPPNPVHLHLTHRRRPAVALVQRCDDVLHLRLYSDQLSPEEITRQWYVDQALPVLSLRMEPFVCALDLHPTRVSIRSQRTRWGSCSTRGAISLNWRLLLLPTDLSDYVLVHELCHLRHMNHSLRFWDLVATQVPDHKLRRKRLQNMWRLLPL